MQHPLVLDPGQTLQIVLTDFICASCGSGAYHYDLGVEIDQSKLHGSRHRLSGRARTNCPNCGAIHEALRHYCEFEFHKATCSTCANPLFATVVELRRNSESPSFEAVEFVFVVELSCRGTRCKLNKLVAKVAGALSRIKRISIGPKGIEVRTDDESSKC